MLFVTVGEYGIGYEINKEPYFAKKMKHKTVIGDYYILSNKRSEFLYKAIKQTEGYSLRKVHMIEIFNRYKSEEKRLTHQIKIRYKTIIRSPLLEHKEYTMLEFARRHDFD